jgi:anti-sigma B factor antagonist
MEIRYDDVQDNILILKADGALNAQTGDEFIDSIEKMVGAGMWNIIVDCSELDHLSSSGLGVLVRIHKRMGEGLGEIKIAGAKGLIVDVLKLTRLNKLFQIYPDVTVAREAFIKPKKTPIIFQ